VIGNPVAHSKGPLLHNAALQFAGVDAVYVPYLVENLRTFLADFGSSDFAGFSVTIPHKQEALELADEVDPVAKVRLSEPFF
jgi:3-dehydroquinate dehydratase/shikimate dehydrogenase